MNKVANKIMQVTDDCFRSIFENAQIGIGIFHIKIERHFSNRALHEMLGYSQEELNQLEKWDEIVHPEERASNAKRYAELVQGHREEDKYTQRFIRRDGQIVTASGRFTLIRDAAGEPQYVIALHEDITERVRAEEALAASERLFRTVFDCAQTGIGIFNIQTGKQLTNRALHENLGYTQEELSRTDQWDEIVHPDDRDLGVRRYAGLVQGARDKDEWVQRYIRRDGRVVIGNGRFKLVRDPSGQPQYVVGLTEDITERRRTEEARGASERLFRSIFENSPLGISVFDVTAGRYHTNEALHKMLGCTHEDLSSREKWELIVHPDEREETVQRRAELLAGKRDNDSWEQRFIRRDGRIVIAVRRFAIVRDASGQVQYLLNLTEDITERKQAEAELVAAKEAAIAGTKTKSEFLANMSHEIRTPMNAILGMTHLALKTELAPKQRDYLTKTKAAAEALLSIVNDVLDFSKIEAGKLNMEHTNFRLDVALDNLSSVVSEKAHEKNLEFLLAAPVDLPAVLVGDPLRLSQVLINLVNNAVKFTERGEVVLTVQLEQKMVDRVKLKFTVRDSGIGMTSDQIARLFQAFSQADSSTTRRYGGTGLGLSISKRLVEMMEGSIWVESEYGRGTTFCFTAWFGVESVERPRQSLPPALNGVRVLVVDDNALAREILTDVLRQFSLRVECVSSGDEALRELVDADAVDPYRLVLIDWQMPGLNGLATSRSIKRSLNLRVIPKIVIVTAFGMEDIRLQAQPLEIEGFLQKPVSPSVVFDMLVNLFGTAREEKTLPHLEKSDRHRPLASGIRVLLVEDNEVNQQVATELLESEGADVTIAGHGAEAVKLLTTRNPPPSFDIVLMDLQMPEMDGFTAARLLRAEPGLQHLPIIAMTAHAMAEDVQRCLEAGMNDHVAKPIDPGAFFATLTRWTGPHHRELIDGETPAASTKDEIKVPEIQGIDVVAGVQRLAGNIRLYRDLLAQFVAKQGSASKQIAIAVQSGNRYEAERLAHSLKGIAGNLGIEQTFDLAGKLEKAIRGSFEGVDEVVKELAVALDWQVWTIQKYLKADSTNATKQQPARLVDGAKISAAAERLRELLEANDADAPEAYADFAELLHGTVDGSRLSALGAAVNAFDFQTALVKLHEIASP